MKITATTFLLLPVAMGGLVALAASAWRPLAPSHRAHERDGGANPVSVRARAAPPQWATLAPFRRDRKFTDARYGMVATSQAPMVMVSREARPQLVLRGVIGGSTPTALVDGLPGIEGTRGMRVGERIGDLELTGVGRHEARIRGSDTTWVLVMREAGQ